MDVLVDVNKPLVMPLEFISAGLLAGSRRQKLDENEYMDHIRVHDQSPAE